mgnify:FL=1|tara:strand:+ start:4047 stop:4709 length:663 start_codon:yes stop_codon:yes gene_type:complete
MKIKAPTGGGSSFEPISEDLHPSVCIGIIGIGPQTFTWEGKEKVLDKVIVVWEIPAERRTWTKGEVEHEGPATISKEYTISLHEKSILRKHLKGWRGKDFTAEEVANFDLESLLGKNNKLMVTHSQGKGTNSDKTYANVDTITPFKGEAFTAESELVYYDSEEHTAESFAKIKEWMQKKVILPDGSCPYVEGGNTGDVANSTNVPAIVDGGDDEQDSIPF